MEPIVVTDKHATTQIYAAAGDGLRWGISLWTKVNRKRHYNKLHAHPYSTRSGVYYVDSDKKTAGDSPIGALTFINPNLPATNTFFTKDLSESSAADPAQGLTVLFPRHLQHLVKPCDCMCPPIFMALRLPKRSDRKTCTAAS